MVKEFKNRYEKYLWLQANRVPNYHYITVNKETWQKCTIEQKQEFILMSAKVPYFEMPTDLKMIEHLKKS